eukprot:7318554-Alexandrium_andersonii.AAC.1
MCIRDRAGGAAPSSGLAGGWPFGCAARGPGLQVDPAVVGSTVAREAEGLAEHAAVYDEYTG